MALFGLLKAGLFTGEIKDFGSDTPPDISHKDLEWRAFRREANPAFDPNTQKLGMETTDVQPTEIVVSRAVIALSPGELDGVDKGKIINASLDHAFITIKLVDILLAKAVIAANDFDTETKQEFLDMKALVDRLRP